MSGHALSAICLRRPRVPPSSGSILLRFAEAINLQNTLKDVEVRMPCCLLPLVLSLVVAEPQPKEDAYRRAMIAAIHAFSDAGETEHLRTLLERYPGLVDAVLRHSRPRRPDTGTRFRPLHRAVARGRFTTARLLLGKGADPNSDGGFGWTPLHVAAQAGDLAIVELLVEKGANVRAMTDPRRRLCS